MEVNKPMPDGRGRGRTSQARIARMEALELRILGLTYRVIGDKLGRSVGWAHKAVDTALTELGREKADELRELELARLDRMMARHMAAAIGGDRASAHTVLRIMERRAKLVGLDNPQITDAVAEGSTLLAGLAAQLATMPDTYEPVVDQEDAPTEARDAV